MANVDADDTIVMIKSYVTKNFTRDGLLRSNMIPPKLTLSTPQRTTIWVKLAVKERAADGGLTWAIAYGQAFNFSMTVDAQVCVAKPVRVQVAARTGAAAPPPTCVRLRLFLRGQDPAQVIVATVPVVAFHSPRALSKVLARYAFANGVPPLALDFTPGRGDLAAHLERLLDELAQRSPNGQLPIVHSFAEMGLHEPIPGLGWSGRLLSYPGMPVGTDKFVPLPATAVECSYDEDNGPFCGAFAQGPEAALASGAATLAWLLRLVGAASPPASRRRRQLLVLALPPYLVAAFLRTHEGALDTPVVCLVGPSGAGKSLTMRTVLRMLGCNTTVNLSSASAAGAHKLLERGGQHGFFGGEDLGARGLGSSAFNGIKGVTADLVQRVYAARAATPVVAGSVDLPQIGLFTSIGADCNFMPPGKARAAHAHTINSRVATLLLPAEPLGGSYATNDERSAAWRARGELSATLAPRPRASRLSLVLPLAHAAARDVVAQANQPALQLLATAISNQSGVSDRLAIGFALMQHGAARMLERLAPADRLEFAGLEAEMAAIVVGLAEEAARSHTSRAREPGARNVGGGFGVLLDDEQTAAAAEATLVCYLDRLAHSFDQPLGAATGAAGALADGGSGGSAATTALLARATNVPELPESDESGAPVTGRKRKLDPTGDTTVAPTFGSTVISMTETTNAVAYVSLSALLDVLKAPQADTAALTPAKACWSRGKLVVFADGMQRLVAGAQAEVIAVQLAHLPAGSAFKLLVEARFAVDPSG